MRHEITDLELAGVSQQHTGKSVILKGKIVGRWQGEVPDHCAAETRTDLDSVTIKADGFLYLAERCSCKVNYNTGLATIQFRTSHKLRDVKGAELGLARRAAKQDWMALASLGADAAMDDPLLLPEISLAWSGRGEEDEQ